MAGRRFTPVGYDRPEAGTNTQSHAPSIDALFPSEFLRSLARHFILNLGTHTNVLNMEANGRDGLKVEHYSRDGGVVAGERGL
jgi:hypothetical protein